MQGSKAGSGKNLDSVQTNVNNNSMRQEEPSNNFSQDKCLN